MPNQRFIHGRRRWVGAKIEVERGTPETLVASDYAILGYDPEINPEVEFEQREPAGLAMGQMAAEPTGEGGRARVRVELRGGGAALPHWAQTLLVAAGLGLSAETFGPISDFDDQKTVTFAVNEDGLLKQLTGAMCNAVITGDTGKRTFVEFDIRGIWMTPVTEAVPTGIAHEVTRPLMLKGAVLTVGGNGGLKVGSFRFDLGNTIELRDDESRDEAFVHAYLAERRPVFEMDPEARTPTDHDLFGQWIARTESALSLALGSTAGNDVAITAPKLQYIDPREATRKSLMTHQTRGQLNTVDGDDEFAIAFTLAAP